MEGINENKDRVTKKPRQGCTLEELLNLTVKAKRDNVCNTWGIKEVDEKYGYITRGTATIFSGRHGSGKSTLLNKIVMENARAGKSVVYLPLEMGAPSLYVMAATDKTNRELRKQGKPTLDYKFALEGGLSDPGFEDIRVMYEENIKEVYHTAPETLVIVDEIFLTPKESYDPEDEEGEAMTVTATQQIQELKDELTLIVDEHKPQLIAIDHLHSMRPDKDGVDYEFYTAMSTMLKGFAKTYGVAIFGICQLTKEAQDKAIDISGSMFKGTSGWTQDSFKAALMTGCTPPRVTNETLAKNVVAEYNALNEGLTQHKPARVYGDKIPEVPPENSKKKPAKYAGWERHQFNWVSVEQVHDYVRERFFDKFGAYREIHFVKARNAREGATTVIAKGGDFEFYCDGRLVVGPFDKEILEIDVNENKQPTHPILGEPKK